MPPSGNLEGILRTKNGCLKGDFKLAILAPAKPGCEDHKNGLVTRPQSLAVIDDARGHRGVNSGDAAQNISINCKLAHGKSDLDEIEIFDKDGNDNVAADGAKWRRPRSR
jgi:hypothetical protein